MRLTYLAVGIGALFLTLGLTHAENKTERSLQVPYELALFEAVGQELDERENEADPSASGCARAHPEGRDDRFVVLASCISELKLRPLRRWRNGRC